MDKARSEKLPPKPRLNDRAGMHAQQVRNGIPSTWSPTCYHFCQKNKAVDDDEFRHHRCDIHRLRRFAVVISILKTHFRPDSDTAIAEIILRRRSNRGEGRVRQAVDCWQTEGG